MTKIIRRLLTILVAVSATSVVLVPTASAGTRDLVVITSSKTDKTLKVCRSWYWQDGRTTNPTPCGDGTGYLPKDTNSQDKLGWKDTDGIRVDRGYALREAIAGPDRTIAACRSTTFWKKVSPAIYDPGVNENHYYLWDCPAYGNG